MVVRMSYDICMTTRRTWFVLRVLAKGKLRMMLRFEVLLFRKPLMFLEMLQRGIFYRQTFSNDEDATYPDKRSRRYSWNNIFFEPILTKIYEFPNHDSTLYSVFRV
ncbi:uncharacterized protein LOC116141641 [Pistacia vera]|uniref:uncharacterized protein LOC116141641 n=1 Tax=Pistacia vera TaxID=55513 RepID=UPI001263634A|nr:uncharacterized protein LOC116141641 [Pistacia vera]